MGPLANKLRDLISRTHGQLLCLAVFVLILSGIPKATGAFTNFINFETAPVHPIALGPDGKTLAICNLPDNRLELFDVSSGIPAPLGNVPVGLDPVTVRFASSNELWVVNHISSTINIIDLRSRNVIATLETLGGPTDLVFAGNPRRAWVSCMRTNAVMVLDPTTRSSITNIAIQAERPRAMAVSPDGSKVYVAIFESGNDTTVLGPRLTPVDEFPDPGPIEDPRGPYRGVNPPPNAGTNFSPAIALTNPPPAVSLIVRKNSHGRWMDDNNGDWTEWVSGTNAALSGRIRGWDLADRDVAILNTTTFQVDYARHLMNICMAIAVNPVSGQVAVVGTEALNEKRYAPVINGVFLRVNLALVDPVTRTNRIRDLNPHLDYQTRTLPQNQRAMSLGDPRGIEWSADGSRAYITGMGSRNLIIVSTNGTRLNPQPIELEDGPTGLALDEPRQRLYVWNRFASTISVVDTAQQSVVASVPVFDPTPDIIRKGRRHLYDTRKTSGLGIASCASCHVDARGDRLAWDLGDPAGNWVTNLDLVFHPMKGPMVTQTLQDIITPTNFNGQTLNQQPLHWRGEKKGIEDFNMTFMELQANDVELTTNEMAEFKAMLSSIYFPPNFFRTFSNTLPASVPLPGQYGLPPAGGGLPSLLPIGNAQRGFQKFDTPDCRLCHGFNQGLDIQADHLFSIARNGDQGAFKASQLRSAAEKIGFDRLSTNSLAGFGFVHDGRVDSLTSYIVDGFPDVATTDQTIADIVAFLMCFSGSDLTGNPSSASQDVPAATGKQVTFSTPAPPELLNAMFQLAMRTNSRVELVLRGRKDGQMRSWLLRRATQDFQSDRHGEIVSTLSQVIAPAAPGVEFTAMLVPQDSGTRIALDRDGDGYFDTSETETGFNPSDPGSHPGRIVSLSKNGTNVTLAWASAPGARYSIQASASLSNSYSPAAWTNLAQAIISAQATTSYTDALPSSVSMRFYRVRLE